MCLNDQVFAPISLAQIQEKLTELKTKYVRQEGTKSLEFWKMNTRTILKILGNVWFHLAL